MDNGEMALHHLPTILKVEVRLYILNFVQTEIFNKNIFKFNFVH